MMCVLVSTIPSHKLLMQYENARRKFLPRDPSTAPPLCVRALKLATLLSSKGCSGSQLGVQPLPAHSAARRNTDRRVYQPNFAGRPHMAFHPTLHADRFGPARREGARDPAVTIGHTDSARGHLHVLQGVRCHSRPSY
ncbi:hypothetical protein MRX96_040069 [Rhipicephalus microplus]